MSAAQACSRGSLLTFPLSFFANVIPATSASSPTKYDATIIGGGPAGASTGAILGEYGHRVLILEREDFSVTVMVSR